MSRQIGFYCTLRFSSRTCGNVGLFEMTNAPGKPLTPDEAEKVLDQFADAFRRNIAVAREQAKDTAARTPEEG